MCIPYRSLSIALLSSLSVLGLQFQAHSAQLQSGANEPSVLIDFEDFAAGDYITGDEWAEYGVTLSVASNRQQRDGSGSLPLRLFNSDCVARVTPDSELPKCTGGDKDLATGDAFGTELQGNVLIIQEDNSHKSKNNGTMGGPDDDVFGGLITFNFEQAVSIESFGFLDFDDRDRGEGYIRAYTEADDADAAITFNLSDISFLVNPEYQGDNSVREFDAFGDSTFRRLEVEYPGSGAITHLNFVPEVAPGGSQNWAEDPESAWW